MISFRTFLQQQAIVPKTFLPSAIGAELSQTSGASCNALLRNTQQQRKHKLVHRHAAIVATKNMTQDPHLPEIRTTQSSHNKKQHNLGWESILICRDDG
jgi:hypothetical protein